MQRFLDRFVADPKPRLELYQGARAALRHEGIEARIDANLGRKVWLKSGGYLIVDQSEALTAIDVNTGRYVGKRDLEETVLKTNLEAVQEVVHQLRFRNIGGLIIIDLIDMESAENREKVYRALQEALRSDKAKHEHPEDLRARARRDDAQAHAREPRAAALRAVQLLRGPRLRALGGERRLQGAARDPQGPAALRRAPDRGVGEPARGRDAARAGAPRAAGAQRAARPRDRDARAAGPAPGAVRGGGARSGCRRSRSRCRWLETREERAAAEAARRAAAAQAAALRSRATAAEPSPAEPSETRARAGGAGSLAAPRVAAATPARAAARIARTG